MQAIKKTQKIKAVTSINFYFNGGCNGVDENVIAMRLKVVIFY